MCKLKKSKNSRIQTCMNQDVNIYSSKIRVLSKNKLFPAKFKFIIISLFWSLKEFNEIKLHQPDNSEKTALNYFYGEINVSSVQWESIKNFCIWVDQTREKNESEQQGKYKEADVMWDKSKHSQETLTTFSQPRPLWKLLHIILSTKHNNLLSLQFIRWKNICFFLLSAVDFQTKTNIKL